MDGQAGYFTVELQREKKANTRTTKRDETLVRLETVSRPRPHPCKFVAENLLFGGREI